MLKRSQRHCRNSIALLVPDAVLTMRTGVRIALDLGSKRIGVARSDRDGLLALPVTVLDAESDWHGELAALLDEQAVLEIVVGLPISLRGSEDVAAVAMRERIAALQVAFPGIPIRIVDERLTSSAANRQLRAAGHTAKSSRTIVDAVAAADLLEFALEFERRTGEPVGELA